MLIRGVNVPSTDSRFVDETTGENTFAAAVIERSEQRSGAEAGERKTREIEEKIRRQREGEGGEDVWFGGDDLPFD